MIRRRFPIALAVLALVAAMPALAKPNFSGDWKLNNSKSAFGQFPPPGSMTSKITHEDPKLKREVKMSGDQGEFQYETTYTTDGKDCSNEMFGNPINSNVKWDGDTLIVDSKGKFGDNEFSSQDKWTLSADGKTLTIVSTFKSAMGDGEQKMVFDKQ